LRIAIIEKPTLKKYVKQKHNKRTLTHMKQQKKKKKKKKKKKNQEKKLEKGVEMQGEKNNVGQKSLQTCVMIKNLGTTMMRETP